MAGTAPTDSQFTRTPDAGPVHCSGWLASVDRGVRRGKDLRKIPVAIPRMIGATGLKQPGQSLASCTGRIPDEAREALIGQGNGEVDQCDAVPE